MEWFRREGSGKSTIKLKVSWRSAVEVSPFPDLRRPDGTREGKTRRKS